MKYVRLMQYIKEYVPNNVRELHLFSDNCPGQNKNNTLIRMCLFLKYSGRFDNIEQYFPIRGHSRFYLAMETLVILNAS